MSNHPATIAVCLSKKGLSGKLIQTAGEFGLNIVSEAVKEAAFKCGMYSGRSVDKAHDFDIGLIKSAVINASLVKDHKVAMECRLIDSVAVFDHTIFIAEVLEAHTNPEVRHLYAFDGYSRIGCLINSCKIRSVSYLL